MIVGQADAHDLLESFQIGSASLAQQFFPDGSMTAASFRAAQWEVARTMQHALPAFASAGWTEAMATSGTAGMLAGMLRAHAITDGTVTPAGLRWLIERCIEAGKVEHLDLAGLKTRRRGLLPGGLAILYTLATHCRIGRLHPAKGALRQGVIIDMHREGLPPAAGQRAGRSANLAATAITVANSTTAARPQLSEECCANMPISGGPAIMPR